MDEKTIALIQDMVRFLENLTAENEAADFLLAECRRHLEEYDAVNTEAWLEEVRLANVI